MAGIGKNRVFDRAALEELLQQTEQLLNSAREVSDSLQEEMQQLQELAGEVPAEAAHPAMAARAGELSGKIGDTVAEIEKTQTAIRENLEKLIQQVPMNDALSAAALKTITSTTAGMVSMAEELKAMVRQGSLHLGMDEFRGQVEDFGNRWKGAAAAAGLKMLAAATFMKGLVEYSKFSRDPVNLSTGNLYYEKEDIRLKAVLPLVFRRYYNAMDRGASALGPGWSHSHAEAVHENKDGSLTLHMEDGKDITLEKDSVETGKTASAVEGPGETYRDTRSGKETVTKTKDGYRYEDRKTRHTLTFDREGRLQKREDKNGNHISYRYDENGRLTCAAVYPAQAPEDSTPAGAEDGTAASPQPSAYLDFTYDKDGLLRTLTDHTGRTVTYFPMDGVLNEVTDPVGHTTTYRYTEDGRLRMVKNPRGIMSLRNEYDENGRITRQRFPDKSGMAYAYDDTKNTTTLTERNGAVITYEQDDRLRNIRTAYQDGSEERDTYDEKDNRTSHTDRNGHTTWYRYDAGSRLTGIVNPLGQETVLTYDENDHPVSVCMEGQELLRSTYDGKGRLTGRSDALGRNTRYTHDHRGLPTAIEAPDGSLTTLTYDEKGSILTVTDPYGAVTAYEYDGLGRVTATTDPEGNRTAYTRDAMDRITAVTDPNGNTREYTYNESGRVIKIKDFDGNEETITYNSINRPECLTDKEGRQTIRRYDSMWNVAEEVSPTGAVTRYYYDLDNHLEKVELCETENSVPERVTLYRHDAVGNLLQAMIGSQALQQKEAEPLLSASYEYDKLNRVIACTDAMGIRTEYFYDALGNIVEVKRLEKTIHKAVYDLEGQMIEEYDSQGNKTTYEYNALGQVCCITDSIGRQTIHEYALGGRLLKTIYSDGRNITYDYDQLGRLHTRKNQNGYMLIYTYDSIGRIVKIESNKGQKKTYVYDVMGNMTAATDANGNTTTYGYTPSGKLASVTDPMGNSTEYRYDLMDNLIYVCRKGKEEKDDRITEYVRDNFGRLMAVKDALAQEEKYRYDSLSRVIWKQDRDGNITSYTYEKDNRVKNIFYADGRTVEMEYDALRRLSCVKDWLGVTEIKRNQAGAPISITDHNGKTIFYEWGKMGEKRSTVYPDGQKIVYLYDNMLRLKETQIWKEETQKPECITYFYDDQSRLIQKNMPNGISTTWNYNDEEQLTELVHKDTNGVLDEYRYMYDFIGNRVAINRKRRNLQQESGNYTYAYDPLGRLQTVMKDSKVLRTYAYDSFGNRIGFKDYEKSHNAVYTYDAMDRLIMLEEKKENDIFRKTYKYDRRGNLVRELENNVLCRSYSYNTMNRLEYAWDYVSDEQGRKREAYYDYNGIGQRTGRIIDGARENYLIDFTKPYHNLLSVTKSDSTSAQTFYWDGNVAAIEETGKLHYYLHDEMGSPVRVSGYNGRENRNTVDKVYEKNENPYLTYGYDEFGNDIGDRLEEEGISSLYSRQGVEQPFGYTGYRYEKIGKMYFAQAREYVSEIGGFAAEDIIRGNGAVTKTLNRYAYCWGNPMSLVDLDGKSPEAEIIQFPTFELPIQGEPDVPVFGGLENIDLEQLKGGTGTVKKSWLEKTIPETISDISDSINNYIKEANDVYDQQRIDSPAPVMPENPDGLPDYTDVIDSWLLGKLEMFQTRQKPYEIMIAVNPCAEARAAGEISLYAEGLWAFYNEVKTGGPMDIKDSKNWESAFGTERPAYFIYHGEIMDPGTLGNITYGYVGASMYPDFMLYYGGGVANMMNSGNKYIPSVFFLPNYGDAPEDIEAVGKGIEMWKKKGACLDD